jgi:succinate dehydrogenase / fumarate reductase flavoprotein subunit
MIQVNNMTYPIEMQESVRKVEVSRSSRIGETFSRLSFSEKAKLLETYHPDFRMTGKKEIPIGPNKGDTAPKEFVALLGSPSQLDPETIDLEKVDYRADVLVIGAGGAGVTTALFAKENGSEVLLATKLRLGDSNTIMAEGGIGAATSPEDSPVIHYIDTIVGGRGKNIPELVEALVNDAPFIVEWLTNLGVNFDRLPDGSYFTHMPAGHSRKRSHSVKDITGLEIMRVLCDEIRNKEINVLEFSPAVELLLDDQGQCAGAVLFNFDTEQYCVVQAKATLIATGGIGRLHIQGFPTSNHYGATADGLVMAYRAGAKLIYMDFIQYHPTGIAWPEQMLGLLISEALRAQGAQVVNSEGEMFVDRLETRDALSAAIIRECGERNKGVLTPTGMVGVWLDTPLIDRIGGEGTFLRRFAGIHSRFKKYDIDPIKEPILIYPTQHYQNGGIQTNVNGETNIPDLYVAGEVAGGVHGHNRLGSNSLVDIFVFGRRAGMDMARKIRQVKVGRLSLDHIKAYNESLQRAQIISETFSPMLLPDYRFEKALTTVQYTKGR